MDRSLHTGTSGWPTVASGRERVAPFFVFTVLSNLVCLYSLSVFTIGMADIAIAMIPFLVIVWIVTPLWAREHIRQEPAREGDILVRWGHPPRPGTTLAYCLYAGAAAGHVLVVIAALIAIYLAPGSSATDHVGLVVAMAQSLLRYCVVLFAAVLSVNSTLQARAQRKEIRESQTIYSSPKLYDVLLAARQGRIILGHEFEHVVTVPVTSFAASSSESLPGEVAAHTIEKTVGQNGPFDISFEKERNPHALIVGSSGTGKTETVRALLLRYWVAKGIPSLIIDYTGEYADFIRQMGGIVWTVPSNFRVNPLKLLGFSPSERAAEVAESLSFSTGLTMLQAIEVNKVILEAYRRAGINEEAKSTWARAPPTIEDIIDILMEKAGQYKGEMVESVNWTARKLQLVLRVAGEEPTDFFETILKIPTCVDMSPLRGLDMAKGLVAYTVLQRIHERLEASNLSQLRLLVVIDEAHLLVKTKREATAAITREPLVVRILRLGRKFGFGLIISSQLIVDLPVEIVGNAATVILFSFDEPQQIAYVRKLVNLSKAELEMYARLPQGGCFVKRLGERYPALVKVQRVDSDEILAARNLAQLVSCTRTIGAYQPIASPSPASRTVKSDLPSPVPRLAVQSKPSEVSELRRNEERILHLLSSGPITMKALLQKLSDLEYRAVLSILHELESEGLIQTERVANVEGKGTVYYAALKSAWLQSESVEHRAMRNAIVEALGMLGPLHFEQSQSDSPDIGIEKTVPKIGLEIETGRKKMTPEELNEWARKVKERNSRLGYLRTLVVVPNLAVQHRYSEACAKCGLELVTMAGLLRYLDISEAEAKLWKALAG